MNYGLKGILLTILFVSVCVEVVPSESRESEPVPKDVLIEIMRAEDELRFDDTLAKLLKNRDASIRKRAALAAGRIGDEAALPRLTEMILSETDSVAQMAAFAIGEIESTKAAESVLNVLKDADRANKVRARAVEAAGKIAGANSKADSSAVLGRNIVEILEFELRRGDGQSRDVILLGITALIRSKPAGGDKVLSRFLANKDGRVRTDAANGLARLNSKGFKRELQAMLRTDREPLARANAARVLGRAKDKSAVTLLLAAAVADKDLRVRVNALNALGSIAEKATGAKLVGRAEALIGSYRKKIGNSGLNELLTIAGALGRIMEGSGDQRTLAFLNVLRKAVEYRAPEVELALVRVSPAAYAERRFATGDDWRKRAAFAAALGFAESLKKSKGAEDLKRSAEIILREYLISVRNGKVNPDMSFPAVLNAYSRYKTADLPGFLRDSLKFDDVVIRASAARLLGEQELAKPPNDVLENYFALRDAFDRSESDKLNDATLAALNAIKIQYVKLKSFKPVLRIDLLDPVRRAAYSPDYLVRRRARAIAEEVELGLRPAGARVRFNEKRNSRLKLSIYARALARKKATAILTTTNGKFSIEFFPEAAPLTVDNFISLARSGYFNGLAIHRVVPNFVVQDGDPRGDGSGGPGWHIRCEINQIPYERGTVGMALSGKDTGGSQWFVAHSPQPHLDGGYTVFGKVNEANMKVVDRLVRGDVIEKIEIID